MIGKTHILVLDNEKEELEIIEYHFNKGGVTNYQMFTNKEDFFASFTSDVYLAIVDYTLNGGTAVAIADEIQELNEQRDSFSKCEVIIISGTRDIRVPVYFMNERKADYFLLKNREDKGNESFYLDLVVYAQKAIHRQTNLTDLEKRQHEKKGFYEQLTIPNERG